MEKNFKLFCFGFGQVAKKFVENLINDDFNFDLVTTNTSKTEVKKFKNKKHKSFFFKDGKFDRNLIRELILSNKVLISISPKNQEDITLNNFNKIFKKNKFDWVTYLSATSVYGDQKGKWVNEKIKPNPTSQRGKDRLKAETQWLEFFKKFNLPVQIFRLSGIYSTKNNAINRLKKRALKIVKKKNHFFSRIHVDDIARILTISVKKIQGGQIFNISDNYPCSNIEIAKYAANLIKVKHPKEVKIQNIKNKMLIEFYKDSKKVDNKKMKSFFKYKLKYPTYKEGLLAIKNQLI
jgi:nucleoside-diphosphate-sugar epimerase